MSTNRMLPGIRDYLSSTSVPTLAGFIKKEENICIDYVEQFDTVEDAKKNLIRRYSTIHHNLLSKKPNTSNVRWGKLFEKAKTKESVQVIYLLLWRSWWIIWDTVLNLLAATGRLCHDHDSRGSSQENDRSSRHDQQWATKDPEQQQQHKHHHHQISTLPQWQHLDQSLLNHYILYLDYACQTWDHHSINNHGMHIMVSAWITSGRMCGQTMAMLLLVLLVITLIIMETWQTSGVSSSSAPSLIYQHHLHPFGHWEITNTSSNIRHYEGKADVSHWNEPMRRVADIVVLKTRQPAFMDWNYLRRIEATPTQ